MNFYLAQYDLTFKAASQNFDPCARLFCSDPRVEWKGKDSAEEGVAKKIKYLYVCFFSPYHSLPHTAAEQKLHPHFQALL
jgi:hypothetical protein